MRAIGRTFEFSFALPESRNAAGIPKAKKKQSRKNTQSLTTKKATSKGRKPKPRVEPTPAKVEAKKENRRAYDRQRNQNPERKAYNRRNAVAQRNEAKSLELCIVCWAPAIPGETRCETCAENHRRYRRDAKDRKIQAREQASGQTSVL